LGARAEPEQETESESETAIIVHHDDIECLKSVMVTMRNLECNAPKQRNTMLKFCNDKQTSTKEKKNNREEINEPQRRTLWRKTRVLQRWRRRTTSFK